VAEEDEVEEEIDEEVCESSVVGHDKLFSCFNARGDIAALEFNLEVDEVSSDVGSTKFLVFFLHGSK